MAHESVLRDKVKILGFDIYDTLLPFKPKFVPALDAYFDAHGYDADPEGMFESWQMELFNYMHVNNAVNEPRKPIYEVGKRALKAVFTEAGFEYTDEEIREVLSAWTELDPHDDVVESFERLREEYTLVGLSNGDPDMLAAIRPTLQGTLDAMLSSAYANCFKPSPEPYELIVDRFDVAPHEVMFVAAHNFDIIGPQRVGMYACFVERVGHHTYGEWSTEPDLRVPDTEGLADALLE